MLRALPICVTLDLLSSKAYAEVLGALRYITLTLDIIRLTIAMSS
jgi:hypothetical protein